MDQQRFDHLARFVGDSQTRRAAIKTFGAALLGVAGFRTTRQDADATIACVLTCPGNISQPNDPGLCGATVNYAPAVGNGACGPITCVPVGGAFFDVGPTSVTCTSGPASCAFTVTVNDTEPPTITCPGNVVVEGNPNAIVDFGEPSNVSDNCTATFHRCVPESGSEFEPGNTSVLCSVNDIHDGFASCEFSVTVTLPPATNTPDPTETPDPTSTTQPDPSATGNPTEPIPPTGTASSEATLAGTGEVPEPTATDDAVDGVTDLPSTGTAGDDGASPWISAAVIAAGAAVAAKLGLRIHGQSQPEQESES